MTTDAIPKGRVLGLDVGSKTIGIAVTDELNVCAHALKTLQRKGTKADVVQVEQLAKQYDTRALVVGIPYDMDGNEGPRALRVRVLIDALVAAGFSVATQDERFSTIEATSTLMEADLSRARRKELVDSMAAQIILTAWLDTQRGGSGAQE